MTDRGVAGRDAPKALDAFVFTERGVYRSGETVFVTALLRDPKGVAAPDLPLTLIATRPDGVEYKRVSLNDQGQGGRAYALPLLPGAASGTWRLAVYADTKGASIGETSGSLPGKYSLLKTMPATTPYRKKSYHSTVAPITLANATRRTTR